jgi:hypothetical protein
VLGIGTGAGLAELDDSECSILVLRRTGMVLGAGEGEGVADGVDEPVEVD